MQSTVVSSSLAGLPTTAEDRRYDGDQSKCAWHHLRSGQNLPASKKKSVEVVGKKRRRPSCGKITAMHGEVQEELGMLHFNESTPCVSID